jgi:ubiquitin C-terminal hydrolase
VSCTIEMAMQVSAQPQDDQMDIDNVGQQQQQQEEASSTTSTPSISQQRKLIKELVEKPLQTEQVWCLIEAKWFESWKHYVDYEKSAVTASDAAVVEENPVGDHPGQIDNTPLLDERNNNNSNNTQQQDPFLNKIRMDVSDRIHFELIPQEAYKLLQQWYGGGPEIARRVISHNRNVIVELHPFFLLLGTNKGIDYAKDDINFKEATFSKTDTLEKVVEHGKQLLGIEKNARTRLWRTLHNSPYQRLRTSDLSSELDLFITKNRGQQLIIEVQVDNEWQIDDGDSDDSDGELKSITTGAAKVSTQSAAVTTAATSAASRSSISSSAGGSATSTRSNYTMSWSNDGDNRRSTPGVCGLQNLGNTCFMNSALQCLTKTPELNPYFCNGDYVREINESNPLGMGGKIASAFGNLMKEMWSGKHSYISPKEFKYTIGKFAPQFSGYQQQDSQELIAYLLDGIHEDLNRIANKPVTEQVESNGRPDDVVAGESWVNHKRRNDSVIVDKFQGQLKSTLVCPKCEHVSITFDPYMYLSLPLPIETSRAIEVTVYEHGKSPTKYQVQVSKRGQVSDLRATLAQTIGISEPQRLVIVEIFSNKVHRYLSDKSDIKSILDNDILQAHVVDESVPLSEDIHTMYGQYDTSNLPFVSSRITTTQKEENRFYRGITMKSVVIGTPFPMLFFKDRTTNKELYDSFFNYLRPYIKFDVAREHGIDLETEDRSAFFPDKNFGKKKQQELEQQRKNYRHQHQSVYDDDDDDYMGYPSSRMHTSSGGGAGGAGGNRWDTDDMRDDDDDTNSDERSSEDNRSSDDVTGTATDASGESASEEQQQQEQQQEKFHLFYLKFEDGNSYYASTFDEENEQGVIVYTDDVVQIPRERFYSSSDRKTVQLYINPEILEELIDYKKMVHVEHDESTKQKTKASGVSLDACLELFTKQEQLGEEDPWYCPKCKEFVQATKKFDIWSLPDVLVIHLKRFQYNKYSRDKLDTYVDYPLDDFDLVSLVQHNADHRATTKYQLFAVSNHFGGLGGGHYTAYAQVHPSGQWYKFDDSFVQSCSAQDAKTSAGYVLFYRIKNDENDVDNNDQQQNDSISAENTME